MSLKAKKILTVVLLILDVLLLLTLIIVNVMSYDMPSTTIDRTFLESAKELYILSTIHKCSLISFIAVTLAFLCVLFPKTFDGADLPEWTLILMVVIAFVAVLVMIVKAITDITPAISNEPVVRTSVVSETYSRHRRKTHRDYYVVIEGQTISVTEEEYKSVLKGDMYYIICCGDKIIKTCNPEKYTIETRYANPPEMEW